MKPKVLVLASTFPRWKWDTEPDFVYWLEDSLSIKFDITVLAPHHPGAELHEKLGGLDVRRFRYFIPRYERLCYQGGIRPNMKKSLLARLQLPLLLLSEFFSVKMLMLKQRFPLIHAHWILPQGLVAVMAKKLFHAKVLVTVHAGDVFPLKSGLLRLLSAWTLRNADAVTVNSIATGDAVRRVADVPMRIIPMGVDLKLFSSRGSSIKKKYGIDGKMILFVGRLAEKKGVSYLISAMVSIKKSCPDCKLLIVGEGPEKPLLEKQIEGHALNDSVIFAGSMAKEKLPAFYHSADVFVLPSIIAKSGDTEGLGVVLLEAIASGVPVVASNVGGIPDIIINGKTGLLVKQKNPGAISDAVISLLRQENKGRALSKAALEHVRKNYSWEKVSGRFSEIYSSLAHPAL
ncbi:MAG: glycosyltransferase [Candidatus Woesearchaeota archaeon]